MLFGLIITLVADHTKKQSPKQSQPILPAQNKPIPKHYTDKERVDLALTYLANKEFSDAVIILDGMDKHSEEWNSVGKNLYEDAIKKLKTQEVNSKQKSNREKT